MHANTVYGFTATNKLKTLPHIDILYRLLKSHNPGGKKGPGILTAGLNAPPLFAHDSLSSSAH